MSNAQPKPDVTASLDTRWLVEDMQQRADGLVSAGAGMEAIGRLLNETDLHPDDAAGLQRAIRALGDYVRRTGYDLGNTAEKLSGGEQ